MAGARLGQHFLTSHTVLEEIVETAGVLKDSIVFEVGAGKGSLTAHLLQKQARVIAVEKDTSLFYYLHEHFEKEVKEEQLTLIEGDIRDMSLCDISLLKKGEYRVVANIPYYITGLVLRFFLEAEKQPASLTLVVQEEVAKRITNAKKESILSLSVKFYATPVLGSRISKHTFDPVPQVDSAILHIKNIHNHHTILKKSFFSLIKIAFASKRKKIKNSGLSEDQKQALQSVGVDLLLRAEDVPFSMWLDAVKRLHA